MPTTAWTHFIFIRLVALHLMDVSEIGTRSARAIRKVCPPHGAGHPDSISPVFSRT